MVGGVKDRPVGDGKEVSGSLSEGLGRPTESEKGALRAHSLRLHESHRRPPS